MCWYCKWGVSLPVAKIYNDAIEKLNGEDSAMSFGLGHIVWEDYNFDRDSVRFCIDNYNNGGYSGNTTTEQDKVVLQSLEELLKLDDAVLFPYSDKYDQWEHSEADFPPTMECVQI